MTHEVVKHELTGRKNVRRPDGTYVLHHWTDDDHHISLIIIGRRHEDSYIHPPQWGVPS